MDNAVFYYKLSFRTKHEHDEAHSEIIKVIREPDKQNPTARIDQDWLIYKLRGFVLSTHYARDCKSKSNPVASIHAKCLAFKKPIEFVVVRKHDTASAETQWQEEQKVKNLQTGYVFDTPFKLGFAGWLYN